MLGRLACLAFAALVVSGRWAGDVAATPHSYPSTPFSPGASPTALALPQPDESRPAGWRDPIWVAVPGHVLELKTRRDGSLAPMASIRLPVGVSVTALAASEAG